jgi:polygalacturonase
MAHAEASGVVAQWRSPENYYRIFLHDAALKKQSVNALSEKKAAKALNFFRASITRV